MDIKKLLKANMVNLLILGLIVGFFLVGNLLFPDHDNSAKVQSLNMVIKVITLLMGTAWAGYTIYSNVTVIKESDNEKVTEVRDRLIRAGNKRFFVKERTHLLNMLESLESRKKSLPPTSPHRLSPARVRLRIFSPFRSPNG